MDVFDLQLQRWIERDAHIYILDRRTGRIVQESPATGEQLPEA